MGGDFVKGADSKIGGVVKGVDYPVKNSGK